MRSPITMRLFRAASVVALITAGEAALAGLSPTLPVRSSALRAQAQASPSIPLVKLLRVNWAWRGDSIEGDYTPVMLVTGVDPASVAIMMHARKGKTGGGQEDVDIDVRMMRSDMDDGHIYRQIWITTDPLVMKGTTSMVLSAGVMRDIATKGSAQLTVVDKVTTAGASVDAMVSLMRALTSDSVATGTPYTGTLTRVEPGTIPFTVLVNDRMVTLPTIHIRGTLTHGIDRYASDMQILADPAFPIVLSAAIPATANGGHGEGGRVVSITYPDSGAAKRLEDDLAARRPVEIYDIYFDYNSAAIKPESDSILRQLGAIMRRHPDWKLRVTGHTDSIGAGDSQPLESNATLEGRARNRRVELTRE